MPFKNSGVLVRQSDVSKDFFTTVAPPSQFRMYGLKTAVRTINSVLTYLLT